MPNQIIFPHYLVVNHLRGGLLRDSELDPNQDLNLNHHPNKYRENQKNRTQLDKANKTTIRYNNS